MNESGETDPAHEPAEESDPIEAEAPPTGGVVDLLLRHPKSLLERFDGPEGPRSLALLAAVALAGHSVYGLVVGSFAQGVQWWAAPLKISAGIAACGFLCFPSLYILVCLSGARARAPQVGGMLLSLLALSGVFLAGFAPVAWIFSQSSNYVSFIAPVHYLVWFVSIFASARVLSIGMKHWRASGANWTALWLLILIVTALQMTTVLRPIVGRSTRVFESERQFFLQHWGRTIASEAEAE